MKHPPIPTEQVLAWLRDHHPALFAVAETDRHWVWLPVDLRGDHNQPVRESIKQYGFRFAKGGHALPSGKTGTWSHSCHACRPFKRRGKHPRRPDQPSTEHDPIAEALAALAT